MSDDNFPTQPSHPEISPVNQPVSEDTVRKLVKLMRTRMGTSDGWTGNDGDSIVSVHPEDVAIASGTVGNVLIPVEEGRNRHQMTNYVISLIPDGFNIEKVSDYDMDAAGAPSLEEIDEAMENVRGMLIEEGVDPPELTLRERLLAWLSISSMIVLAWLGVSSVVVLV